MQVSENWLREWVDIDVDTQLLADTLTMAGLEVDSIELAAPVFSGVVVARVVEVVALPDTKKLHVCKVDDGSGNQVEVICGADNVRTGLLVAFAKVGAVLADNFAIKAKTLCGVESFGMLCSASELGLAESSQGIMELPDDCVLGEDVFNSLALNDVVIDIDLTPNRSDCLSVQGIAREVSALLNTTLKQTSIVSGVDSSSQSVFPVSITAVQDCPRYIGRVIEGVSGATHSPLWMQEKLRRCGVRPINAIIDITNFVMLEIGQPLHAFDLGKLHDEIIVRHARPSECIELLNGQVVKLSHEDLIIADADKPVALAGIMGGAATAVTDGTTDIFLESAVFKPKAIAGKARQYGLHTDSSHRFERGVDPQLAVQAIERATQLILEHVGGTAGPVIRQEDDALSVQQKKITLQHKKVEDVLGIKIALAAIQEILERLYCKVTVERNCLRVIPPSFRFDLAEDVDLIEEVARLVGYENIPGIVAAAVADKWAVANTRTSLGLLKQALVLRGYHEIISFSFVDPALETLLNPGHHAKTLSNPISQELAVMRSSIWPGLIKTAQYNLHRQQTQIRIFEHGLQFIQSDENLEQRAVLSGLVCGDCGPEQWGVDARPVDFYDVKGDVEHLLNITRHVAEHVQFKVIPDPALQSGQSARIVSNGKTIGRLGKLHPRIQSALDINQPFFLFELQSKALLNNTVEIVFQPLSKYPSIRRDITFIVDNTLPAEEICSNIDQMKIPFLQKIEIFSVYTDESIGNSKKSISLGLILQAFSRTLTDKEVEQTISLIIPQLEKKVGAEIKKS